MSGVRRIQLAQDRARSKGYGRAHDVEHHSDGVLVDQAIAYALSAGCSADSSLAPEWDVFKHVTDLPDAQTDEQRIDRLAKAGGLIASEIDRLEAQRATERT